MSYNVLPKKFTAQEMLQFFIDVRDSVPQPYQRPKLHVTETQAKLWGLKDDEYTKVYPDRLPE